MRDHYTFLSPLKQPRESVLRTAWAILRECDAVPTFECEELKYDTELQRYHWTGEFITCGTLEEVLTLARNWEAIATYFEYTVDDVLGNLSILLWSDTTQGTTTLALCEDSTLFNYQREHTESWRAFQETVVALAESLGSSFCLLKSNPPVRTVTEGEVADSLTLMEQGRYVPILLAVHTGRFSSASLLERSSSAEYWARRYQGYMVFTDKAMGSPASEDG